MPIQRYSIGLSMGLNGKSITVQITDCDGDYVLYADHLAALAEKDVEIARTIQFGLEHTDQKNEQIAGLTTDVQKWIRIAGEYQKSINLSAETLYDLTAECDNPRPHASRGGAALKETVTNILHPEPLGEEFQKVLNEVPYEERKEATHD